MRPVQTVSVKNMAVFSLAAGTVGGGGDGKLGSFEMSTVPDVGEVVVIRDVEYVVTGRRWLPSRVVSQVDITVAPVLLTPVD